MVSQVQAQARGRNQTTGPLGSDKANTPLGLGRTTNKLCKGQITVPFLFLLRRDEASPAFLCLPSALVEKVRNFTVFHLQYGAP